MKKIIILVMAFTSCFLFNAAKANGHANPIQQSVPLPAGITVASHGYYPTDIAITNLSSRFVDIHVPVLRFSVRLYPHYVQHIVANDDDPKRVIIYDFNGIVFMDRLVSHHDAFNIYDNQGKTFVK